MQRSYQRVVYSLIASGLLVGSAAAQEPAPRIRILESPSAMAFTLASPNRAVIGVALATGSPGDTLGLEITDVTPDGPAAVAGIKSGSRIQAVNDVSLRISAADANDPLTADAGYRRLQRELGKLEPGDTVTLSVLENGQLRRVSVATKSAASMTSGRAESVWARSREAMESRAGLGMGIGSAGNARDTLGVFITSVVTDGPVEKAGIIEGERVAAINGVDVRVPREDAGDASAAAARVARFSRELAKVEPGQQVSLRVFGNGRYRDVTVTAGKASEFGRSNFMFEMGPGVEILRRIPGAAGLAPMASPRRIAPAPSVAPTPRPRPAVQGVRRAAGAVRL